MAHTRSLFIAVLLLLLVLPAQAQPAPDVAGSWTGQIDTPGQPLEIEVMLTQADDGWRGTIDIPAQNLSDFALAGVTVTADSVHFRMDGVPGTPTFRGALEDDGQVIAGPFMQGGATFSFRLERAEAAGAAQAAATREALGDFDAFVTGAMADWQVPGAAVVLVRSDSVILREGYGLRDVENAQPVTPQTLFAIGSATKAFTATTLGILHDDGVLDWETPVVDMLPEFRLHDPFASREMTAVDLLTHRSGLPRHDLLWYVTTLDRDELLERLRYLEPSEPFRAAFQYQNLMYMTAGILAGHLADTTWEAVTRARLLDPLGMDDATFSVAEIQERPDAARPYGGGLDTTRLLDYKPLDAIGPAGSINASVEDMTAWVRLQLGDGTVGGQEIVTGSTLDFIHAPQVVVSGRRPLAEAPYLMYGLGWFVEPFRGRKMIHHGGNIDGFSALVGFMPDEDLGMVVLTNKNGSPLPRILMLTAFDRILEGDDAVDWNQRLLEQRDAAEDDNGEEETPAAEDDATRVEDTTPSHPLADYAGTYEDPGYGPITVTHADDRLTATYYTVSGTLEHFHYDTFVLTVPQLDSMEVKLTFHTNAEGDIDRLAVPVEMSLDPVTFERVASETLSDPAYLEQFVGSYALRGQTITIALEGAATLTMTVPGQPTYTLVPYKEDGFEIEQLSGFRVLFEQEDGRVVRLLSVQPNGTFAAERIEDGAADGS